MKETLCRECGERPVDAHGYCAVCLAGQSAPRGRGGAREGAGRPPSPNPLKTLSVRLLPEQIDRLREIGLWNCSEGVRKLLAWYDQEHPDELPPPERYRLSR